MYFRLRHRKDSEHSTTKTAANEQPTSKSAAKEELTSKAASNPCKTEPVKKALKKKNQVKKVDKHATMSSSEEPSILEMLEDLAISGSGAGARARSGVGEKLERSLSKSANIEKRILQIKSKLDDSKLTLGVLFTTFFSNFQMNPGVFVPA
jgi:hypothetical protein